MDWVYLDNNATTQPAAEVVAAMQEANATLWANPSSVHRFGQSVRQRVELARAAIAQLIGCRDRELVFTSGGTESNNLALRGFFDGNATATRRILITTPVEHAAIREPAESLESRGIEVVYLQIDRDGIVAPAALTAALDEHADSDSDVLVSTQWANNETGAIQDMSALAESVQARRNALRKPGSRARLLLHTDATQVVGKLPVDVRTVGVDMLTFAAHKFHGPKGVGGLFIRSGLKLAPQQRGGPQERERRGGTENTTGIIGAGVAADLAAHFVADDEHHHALAAMRDAFEEAVRTALTDVVVNAGGAPRLWNTSNLGFPGLEAEAILLGLSERGVCASAGAACSSGSLEPSPVLLAMGVPEPIAHGSVRFSMSRFTTQAELDRAIKAVTQVVERLRQTLPL